MSADDQEVPESPATWENVVVGKAKQALGHAVGDKELIEEGDDQEEIAYEVRDEFDAERQD